MEATKQGTGESLMALIGSNSKDTTDSALQALGTVDEREDGLIIINASGIIMACNKPLFSMFGVSVPHTSLWCCFVSLCA